MFTQDRTKKPPHYHYVGLLTRWLRMFFSPYIVNSPMVCGGIFALRGLTRALLFAPHPPYEQRTERRGPGDAARGR